MLVDYSSSGSSTEDSEPEIEAPATKKIKLPSAADLLKGVRTSDPPPLTDNPDLHGGRIRSFAHERGNWASYCYFKVAAGHLIRDLRKAIQDCCRDSGMSLNLECIEELHLSLTKTVVLQHHWIQSFTQSIQDSLTGLRSRELHLITFDSIKIFENEDHTRTFISLGVSEQNYTFLNQIVAKLDECLGEFKLPAFYEPADYHASFMWCLGSHSKELKTISGKLNRILQDLLSAPKTIKTDDLIIVADSMNCKIGNKLYKIPLVD